MAFDKFKRGMKQAFDFRSDNEIRNQRDDDETGENLDYMMSRGKSTAVKQHNEAQSEEGLRIRRRAQYGIGGGGYAGRIVDKLEKKGPIRRRRVNIGGE